MAKEVPSLLCTKFQPALYLEFDSVTVGSSNTKLFKLQNPHQHKMVVVSVDRVPEKYGFCITVGDDFSKSVEIEANGYAFAHVLWCPQSDMAIRESAYLKVDNLPTLQITLHGKAGSGSNKVHAYFHTYLILFGLLHIILLVYF